MSRRTNAAVGSSAKNRLKKSTREPGKAAAGSGARGSGADVIDPRGGSWASSDAVRASMQANRSRDTSPEVALRQELHRRGLRYRVDRRPEADINRRADIVFGPARVAVFIHGCFWHGCRWHYSPPRTNDEYWSAKVARNRARDIQTRRWLRARGWHVVTVWEHEDVLTAADRIEADVRARR